ncbi:MAG TPA: phage/plasmid replication protein, II/X family [Methylobacter sp.]|jgi:II/X family phage/plasmid replication protein
MIDYIDAVIPMKNNGLIRKGYKTITKEDGSSSESNYPLHISGRNGSSIKIQSVDNERVRIIGNLTMFLQGQNVYGTDNLLGLCYIAFADIAEKLEIKPTKRNHRQWRSGEFEVNTIDVTHNFVLPSQSTVCEWMKQAALSLGSGKQTVEIYRASNSSHIETIYVGKTSRFISVKFYNKYRQMIQGAKKQRKIKAGGSVMQDLVDSSKGLLRCEIRFHKGYLKKSSITTAKCLTPMILQEHYEGKLKRIHLGTSKILPVQDLDGLSNLHKLAYGLWIKGGDLKREIPPSSFDRICKKLLSLGVNIRQPFVERVQGKSLRYYLRWCNIAKIPDFLVNTSWYFDPH